VAAQAAPAAFLRGLQQLCGSRGVPDLTAQRNVIVVPGVFGVSAAAACHCEATTGPSSTLSAISTGVGTWGADTGCGLILSEAQAAGLGGATGFEIGWKNWLERRLVVLVTCNYASACNCTIHETHHSKECLLHTPLRVRLEEWLQREQLMSRSGWNNP
jgi:hypothetical protein